MADIELAQSMQKGKADDEATKKKTEEAKPHPYDVNYGLLKCALEHVDDNSDEFKVMPSIFLFMVFDFFLLLSILKHTQIIHKDIVNVRLLTYGVLIGMVM